MAQAIELRNPKALMVAEVQGVFKRAFDSISFAAPGGFDSTAETLFRYVTNDGYFVVLGFEDGHPKGTMMGFFPADELFPYPTITMAYNEGSPANVRAMARQTLDILKSRGYSSAWAVNSSGRPDRAWMRLFRLPGETSIKPLGTVMEIKVV